MLNRIPGILHAYYPQSNSNKEIATSSLVTAVLVYLFLVIYQPFGTYTYHAHNKYLLLTPYAIIIFACFYLGNLFAITIKTTPDILKEITKLFLILCISALLSYVYNINYINFTSFSVYGLLYMFAYTLAIGLPVGLINFLGRYFYLSRIKKSEVSSNNFPSENQPETKPIVYSSSGETAIFDISIVDFIYAKSEGNYCNIFYIRDNTLHKKLYRLSLKEIENLSGNTCLKRCHRSYIVNFDKVIRVSGNAQGYKLRLMYATDYVPVSRKYSQILKNIKK